LNALKRYDAALRDFDAALRPDPDYGSAYHRRGNTYAHLGEPAEAYHDLTCAIALAPNDVPALYDRVGLLADETRLEEALQDYDRVLRMTPHDEQTMSIARRYSCR
jgi:tetratricopeptide (TPR) repeat protein